LGAAATVVALAIASSVAVGQDDPAVKVEASKITIVTQVSSHGIRNEAIQLSRNVSYADLDLTTSSGAAQLESRIRDSADSICKQLMAGSPTTSSLADAADRQSCVNDAVEGALIKAKHVIASAKSGRRG